MQRPPEFEKILVMFASILAAVIGGLSIFVIENKAFIEYFSERREFIISIMGALSAIIAGFAAIIIQSSKRRSQLRQRLRRVFIIYARPDHKTALNIASALKDHEIEPWIDTEQIAAGEVWKDAIFDALNSSAMAIVIISENSKDNEFFDFQLKMAEKNMYADDKVTSPIIPVVIDGAKIPNSLEHIHHVDMSRDDAMEFLIRSIERAMDRIISSRAA